MDWIMDNWYIFVAIFCILVVSILAIFRFFNLPTEKQSKKVKEWLIWACIEAEKALQSGTGQLKLRQVYDMFCSVPAFTWVARIISFDLFSKWVSDALVEVKRMIVNNNNLATYVYGKNANSEVNKIKEQLEV